MNTPATALILAIVVGLVIAATQTYGFPLLDRFVPLAWRGLRRIEDRKRRKAAEFERMVQEYMGLHPLVRLLESQSRHTLSFNVFLCTFLLALATFDTLIMAQLTSAVLWQIATFLVELACLVALWSAFTIAKKDRLYRRASSEAYVRQSAQANALLEDVDAMK